MVAATYSHPAFKVGDGKDIDLNGNFILGPEQPHLIKKAASANVRHSHDTEWFGQTPVYFIVKTIVFPNGFKGTVRYSFDLKTLTAPNPAYARLFHNSVAAGFSTEQSDITGAYVTKTEDITADFNPGDVLTLQVKNDAGTSVYVRNLRISYDNDPTIAVASINS